MSVNDWEQTLARSKQEITSIESGAGLFSTKFEELRRQTEAFKIISLNHQLEEHRRFLARARGYASVTRDRRQLGASLGVAAAGLILAAIVTRDKFIAAKAGLSSFDAAVDGFGDTAWAVSLGKDLTVRPRDNITSGKIWVTWESLKRALAQLQMEASQGVALGGLDDIISTLRTRGHLIYLGSLPTKSVWVRVREQ
jgi:hypothetical protein